MKRIAIICLCLLMVLPMLVSCEAKVRGKTFEVSKVEIKYTKDDVSTITKTLAEAYVKKYDGRTLTFKESTVEIKNDGTLLQTADYKVEDSKVTILLAELEYRFGKLYYVDNAVPDAIINVTYKKK